MTDTLDLVLDRVRAELEEGQSAEEQIERRLDYIVRELDEFCAMANNPETVDLLERERIAVGQICTRAQLIAAFLMARQPAPQHIRRVV